jgi:RND family efflux transporter MFP subunit
MNELSTYHRLRLAAGVGLLSVFILIAGSCNRTRNVEARTPAVSEFLSVAVAKVTKEELSRNLALTAEFKPFQEIEVMAKVSGYVKEINVDVGDRVRQGQLLATLEIPEMADDLARARASIERSSAEVTRAKDEIQRAESAHKIAHLSYERLGSVSKQRPGLVAQQEIDDAHSKDLVAEAQVSAAKSAVASAVQQVDVNKAEMGKVKTLHDYTRVTAPFAGIVTKRYADTGSMIQAGTASQTQAMPLVRLSQNSLLRLSLPVPESVVASVRVGGHVDVKVPALNRVFPGKVARFAEKVQSSTRTMDTEVDVPNPSLILIPGMYAEVTLALEHRNDALAVPVSAVDPDLQGSDTGPVPGTGTATGRVMLVTPEGRVEVRKVTLGLETSNLVEIRSGLSAGDLVVIGNRSALQSGQQVKPKLTTMAAGKDGESRER